MNDSQTHAAHPPHPDQVLAAGADDATREHGEPSAVPSGRAPAVTSAQAPAHWLSRVQSAGPPAHWVEKVREAAPHLLPPEIRTAHTLATGGEAEVAPPFPDVAHSTLAVPTPRTPTSPTPAAPAAVPPPPAMRPQPSALRVRAVRLHQVDVSAPQDHVPPAVIQQGMEIELVRDDAVPPVTPHGNDVTAGNDTGRDLTPSIHAERASHNAEALPPRLHITPSQAEMAPYAHASRIPVRTVRQHAVRPAPQPQPIRVAQPKEANTWQPDLTQIAPEDHTVESVAEPAGERGDDPPLLPHRRSSRSPEMHPSYSARSQFTTEAPDARESGHAPEPLPLPTDRAAPLHYPAPDRNDRAALPIQTPIPAVSGNASAPAAIEAMWSSPARPISENATHWPALLEAQAPEPPSVEAMLRVQARRWRLDREQRGAEWNA